MQNKTKKEIRKIRLKKNFMISGVYFLFDENEIVYIGQSRNIYRRINHHTRFKWGSFSFIEAKEGRESRELEKHYIDKFKPKYNKRSNA